MHKQENVRNSQSATSLFFEGREKEKYVSQPSKRQIEKPEHQAIVINTPNLNSHSSALAQETFEVPPFKNKSKEKLALKLNSLNDRKARYKSHRSFLTKCRKEKVMPHGLSIYIEPSIGNQDSEFLETWNERLQAFSLTLISDVVNFRDRATENVSKGIEKTKRVNLTSNLMIMKEKRYLQH